uniref:ATP synthase peripheral stalk subunit F6, mitochondrial n=1 Tax=Panthera leo TaxID=9689 RepID=A0A8C8X2H4_PANLE
MQRLFRFSSVIRFTVSVHLRRNIGIIAAAFTKELDPVQKLFIDRIREYRTKHRHLEDVLILAQSTSKSRRGSFSKLNQMYGKADMNTFPNFTFEDPKSEAIEKLQS